MSKKGLSISQKHGLTGWLFLGLATVMILWMNFYPMIKALWLSLQPARARVCTSPGF